MAYPSNGVIYVKAERLVPAVLRALSVVLVRIARSTQRLGLRRRDDQRHLRHRPDDRDPERPHRHRRRHPRPGRGRHARPHRRRLRARRARHQRLLRSRRRPTTPTCNNMATGDRRDRRRDPHPAALGHRRPLLLRKPDRHADGQRHDRAEVPRRRSARTAAARCVHGYLKDYQYDPRLAFRSPPHFLDPVKSAWHVHALHRAGARGQARRGLVRRRTSVQRAAMGSRPHRRGRSTGCNQPSSSAAQGQTTREGGTQSHGPRYTRKPGCGTGGERGGAGRKSSPRRT